MAVVLGIVGFTIIELVATEDPRDDKDLDEDTCIAIVRFVVTGVTIGMRDAPVKLERWGDVSWVVVKSRTTVEVISEG